MKIKLIDRYAARLIADSEMQILKRIPFYEKSEEDTEASEILFFCAMQEDADTFKELFAHMVRYSAYKKFSEGVMEKEISDVKTNMYELLEKGEEK